MSESRIQSLVILLVVVLLLVVVFAITRQNQKFGNFGHYGSARVQAAPETNIQTHSVKVGPLKDNSGSLVILSNVTLKLPTSWQGNSYGLIPLTSETQGCQQFLVTAGPYANTPTSIAFNGGTQSQNTLQQQAWNNLYSQYLSASGPVIAPNVAPLPSASGSFINFQQCAGTASASARTSVNLSSSTPLAYVFPAQSITGLGTGFIPLSTQVVIPQNTFLLRVYFTPSNNAYNTISVSSMTVALAGYFNGTFVQQQIPAIFQQIDNYTTTEYFPISTEITYSPDGSSCVTIANVSSPQIIMNATFSDNTTLSETIDIVQNTFAIPPVGTWILDNALTLFNAGGTRPQSVLWLNDAINAYVLPQETIARMPSTKIPLEGRVMPSSVAIFSSRPAFAAWKAKNNRTYSSQAEEDARYTIFRSSVARAAQLNQQQPYAHFGATKFADMTGDELKRYLGNKPLTDAQKEARRAEAERLKAANANPNWPPPPIVINSGSAPAYYDWREHGAVKPVKNQGNCPTCWDFSGVGAVEAAWFFKTGNLVSLSEQQFLSCPGSSDPNTPTTNCGFNDGNNWQVFENLVQPDSAPDPAPFSGLMSEQNFPYKNTAGGPCLYSSSQTSARITGYNQLCDGWTYSNNGGICQGFFDSGDFVTALYQYGPISICGVDICDWFYLYEGGVLMYANNPQFKCYGTHCMLLVGYGVDCGQPYWLLKNSWGTDFGEQGYVRIYRPSKLHCKGCKGRHET